jgi:UDP-N-acetylmuramoyl-L-alanyl-D-glutamate--2,6-diaminopimelate ligase
MNLSCMTAALDLTTTLSVDPEITGLAYDSRRVAPGVLFFALPGAVVDGHRFIGQAVESGAAAIVLEDPAFAPKDIPWVEVTDARLALARMASHFYGDPTANIPVIGITGTNGKTTTTYLVEAMLAAAGIPAAVLGTISYRFGDFELPAPHTTPESADLQQLLRQLVDRGAKSIVMEVSSHALEQHRADGCHFDVGLFSNLTPEHLDYHHDMAAYLASKRRLFSDLLLPDAGKPRRRAVINSDDPAGAELAAAAACPVITYGLDSGADVTVRNPVCSVAGISGIMITPTGEFPFQSEMLGRFNLYNILAATGAGTALELPLDAIRAGIERHRKVPGRMERVPNDHGVTLLVDYAHTGDALENVLKTICALDGRQVITVFGCGGDRDRTKRPVMAEVAGRFSDLTIITSDNPRTEEPAAIIAEVRSGILPLGLREYQVDELAEMSRRGATPEFEKGFTTVQNRRNAISLAVRFSRPGDIVLLAGKGHEDYQIIGTTKQHFDDREEAATAFREKAA